MVEEKNIGTAPNAEETNSDWAEDYAGERPQSDGKYFSDKVPEGDLSFKAEITFKDEGNKTIAKTPWGDRPVIKFVIDEAGKEKVMEIGTNQFDYLKLIADNKPLTGKTAIHERTGEGQKATRRTIKFKQE